MKNIYIFLLTNPRNLLYNLLRIILCLYSQIVRLMDCENIRNRNERGSFYVKNERATKKNKTNE